MELSTPAAREMTDAEDEAEAMTGELASMIQTDAPIAGFIPCIPYVVLIS